MGRILTASIVLLGCAGLATAQYNPYFSDQMTTVNSANWYANGSLSAGGSGITSSSGGALVSKVTVPTYPNDYLVQASVMLTANTNGGYFGVMARASSNALASPATGSFYLLELQNPTWTNGSCSATLAMIKVVNGSWATLSSGATWCSASPFNIQLAMNGTGITWFMNGQFAGSTSDSSITTGAPGISVRSAPGGNSMNWALLYPGDHTQPASISPSQISTNFRPYLNNTVGIDFQWQAPSDGPTGSGLAIYVIFRNGQGIAGYADNLAEFTDNTAQLSTTYSYNIVSCDKFYNCSNSVFNVTTPPAGFVDTRQIGMPVNGTSWGGGGENINILSGNLNYSLPLLTAQGRAGMKLGIGLNYNSQNWREDGSVSWNYGRDIGYGYGFRVLAGSMQQFLKANWAGTDHWEFTDSAGTQYRLDQQVTSISSPTPTTANTGYWTTSADSATFLFNANKNQLYFPNGTVWTFGDTSLGAEGDETAMYPTVIEDSNGNQILIRYEPGVLAVNGTQNVYVGFPSSGRIAQIEDVRAQNSSGTYLTYQFTYNNDPGVPHLTGITNNISTSEGYSFTYNLNASLTSPWGGNFQTATQLASVTISGIGLNYQFSYDGAAELTKVVFPYGGYISWQYGSAGYSGSRNQMEVTGRIQSPDGSTQYGYPFVNVTHDANNTMRQSVTLNDAGGVGQKVWTFNAVAGTGAAVGLLNTYKGNDLSSGTAVTLQQINTGWATAPFGDYMWSISTTMNPGTSNATTKLVTQTLDQFGNLTQMQVNDYSGAVRRTYSSTYLSSSAYAALYIRNRLLYTTVTEGSNTYLLANNWYDAYTGFSGSTGAPGGDPGITCSGNAMTTAYTPREFDTNYTSSFTTRGNLTVTQTPSGISCVRQYDNTGTVLQTADTTGVITSDTSTSTTNYALPSSITTGSLTANFQYASNLLPTQAQGPNGDTTSTVYDSYARPASSTSTTGAVTYFNYVNSPPQTLSYTNPNNNSAGRVMRTTLDGFGRTIKTESGTGSYSGGTITLSTVISQSESTYAPCGCSPLGKLTSVTRPHAPGVTNGGKTTYVYDGIGRTVSVTSGGTDSGGSTTTGTTGYAYAGATVTITDPAGKWKAFYTDAVGNLTQVTEPNPAGGSNLLTNYTYTTFNKLYTVSMPRSNGTQTRTFNYSYNSSTGSALQLTSVNNPENGTVTNYYNTDQTLNYRIDAKGQKIQFTYDSYKRVTQVSKFPNGTTEDACQRVTYNYDSDPDISTSPYTQYLAGRLASIHYGGANCQWVASQFGSTGGNNYIEMFAYTQAGKIINKRFRRWYQTGTLTPTTITGDLEAVYTYDQEGKMLTQQYPQGGTYTYSYDALGRATGLTDSSNNNLVSSVTYGPAGEVLTMAGTAVNETRTYNALGQLKTLVGLNGVNLQYNYSATANNGQIASQYDVQSGETVTYAYDQLKRLSAASSTQGWGQTFTYDGFGNLTAKNASSGSPPVGSYPTDPGTNRLTSYSYDANGNQLSGINIGSMGYDVSNRMVSVTTSSLWGAYEYNPGNRRVRQLQQSFNGSTWVTVSDVYYFYGLNGKKIETFTASVSGTTINWIAQSTQVFFKGRLITAGGTNQQMDVRGSVGKYYPYGENRGTPPPADSVQFATYTGDSVSGLDYAVNRYYASGTGRLTTPDPYRAAGSGSAGPATPASWNRYSYSLGDPANYNDAPGLYALVTSSGETYDGNYETEGQACAEDPSSGCEDGYIAMQAALLAAAAGQPQSKFPKCNPNGSPSTEKVLAFIAANYKAAAAVAAEADQLFAGLNSQNFSAVDVLGWAAAESGYTSPGSSTASGLASGNLDYFNLTAGTNWINQVSCPAGYNTYWACFGSFQGAAEAALFSPTPGQFNGEPNASAGYILGQQLGNGASLTAAFTAMSASTGFSQTQGYGSGVQGAISAVSPLLDCLKNNYAGSLQ